MKKDLKILKVDYVIIGAGTIGLFLFNELKRLKKTVILIERGSKKASIKKTRDILSKGKHHKGTFLKRAFGMGGNSTLWGGQLVEFLDQDLAKERYDLGFKKNELRQLYSQLYKIFNIKKVSSEQYLKQNSIKFNGRDVKYFFSNWLREPNFAKYYENILQKNSDDIFLNTEIRQLNLSNRNIKSIEIIKKNKKISINTKNCVVTMGTIETIKFFLNNKKLIIKKNLIGKYFQDHLGIYVGKVDVIDKKKFSRFFENGLMNKSKYQPKLFYQEIKKNFSLGASGEFKFYSKNDTYIYKLKNHIKKFMRYKKIQDLSSIILLSIKLNKKIFSLIYAYFFNKKIKSFYDKGIKFYIQSEQIPLKRSNLKFDSSKKKFILDWKIDGKELKFLKNFATKANHALEKEKIAKINISQFINYNTKKFKSNLRDTNHPAGGLVLSFNNNKGLVNKNFCVNGTKNLYVIGNCLYKKSSFANITFTTLALALKFINRVRANV